MTRTALGVTSPQDQRVKVRSGSILRNSGAHVSWRMVPASPVQLKNTSYTSQPDCSPEDQEVVLREVEGNKAMDEAEPEHEGRYVFQTTVTLSSAAGPAAVG